MKKISPYLNHGGVSAISASDLSTITNLDDRKIRLAVEAERLSGTVILTNERGYFLPSEDRETAVYEIMEWLGKMSATARSYERIIRSAQSAVESLRMRRE